MSDKAEISKDGVTLRYPETGPTPYKAEAENYKRALSAFIVSTQHLRDELDQLRKAQGIRC